MNLKRRNLKETGRPMPIRTLCLVLGILSMTTLKAAADPAPPVLKAGDRLALCGDSMTSVTKHSAIMTRYLYACRPELNIEVFQSAISGEDTARFLRRVPGSGLETFRPTFTVIWEGHNDSRRDTDIVKAVEAYRVNLLRAVDLFQANGGRVGLASCALLGPGWGKNVEENRRFVHVSDLNRRVAREKGAAFAEVTAAMNEALTKLKKTHGPDYDIVRGDGGHGSWHGHMAIAIAFLRSLGLQSELARIEYEPAAGRATASTGHKVIKAGPEELVLESTRYPFCFLYKHPAPDVAEMWDVAEALNFFEEFNRFTLVVKGLEPGDYEVTWGRERRTFSAERLARGINLAYEFPKTPFGEAFLRVANQAYNQLRLDNIITLKRLEQNQASVAGQLGLQNDTGLVQEMFREPMRVHERAVQNARAALVPVTHSIRIRRATETR
ncbi:MAG TPA: GDSL-type esterase/lipase family protein [bacterium]|uniref:SGNH hydrolase-type esterase domain-containing protein n=1 Tax=candidate division TA06 bacterium ADurb.Bin417 TaxID=1852828 RepID=A0A1V5MD65_UNCT6|nr:MAG: hypothetical protein BWY73_01179 [candidate division TA06 bacterium ADurb.Bin417]HNQ35350.1 GDSL-type esterase/lipase family protein [bacterium]HNS48808.1 GDSL-type esterase/lipase family protein [bacterium]